MNPKIQKLFCETFGVEPIGKRPRRPLIVGKKDYTESVYPDLTLDLLFAVAKREGIKLRIETDSGEWLGNQPSVYIHGT